MDIVNKKYRPLLDELQEGTQCHTILKHLLDIGGISALDAVSKYHIMRLSSRIYELRELGVNIKTDIVVKKEKGKTTYYAVYKVV